MRNAENAGSRARSTTWIMAAAVLVLFGEQSKSSSSARAETTSAVEPPSRADAERPPMPPGHAHSASHDGELVIPKVDEEKASTVKLRGRVHADAIFVNQSERNKAAIGDLENAVGFRRARLGAQGTHGEQIRWVCEFDFAGGEISFKDVFLGLDELPVVRQLRIGHFPEPFSLEGRTSSNAITFMERSPINALDPYRNWGIGFYTHAESERATFAFGAFRSGAGEDGADIGDANDMAYTARATGLVWHSDEGERLMHVGGAFSQRYPKDDVVTFKQGPQSSLLQFAVDDPLLPFVPNLSIPANQNQLFNVQWALVHRSLSLQAEWYGTTVDQIGGGPVFLHGSYVYASYFVTGERRAYDPKDGVFVATRVLKPFIRMRGRGGLERGPGAWEVTARLSYLDFDDPNLPPDAAGFSPGTRLTETTIGVNWYLNNSTRLMFNYTHAVPIVAIEGPSAADGFGIRSEIFW